MPDRTFAAGASTPGGMPTTEAMSAFGTVNTGGQLAEDPSNLFFEDDDYVDDDDDDERV
jgi:hypothetical protein